MEKVAIDEVPNEPHPLGVNSVRRSLSDALGSEDVSIVFYELEPGEQFSGGLHTHHDQEEVFYVLDGTATFEVGRDGGEVDVETGELVRFPSGQFQCGRNKTEREVRGLAIGAPGARHNWDDIESVAPCSDCEEVTSHGVSMSGADASSSDSSGDTESAGGGQMTVYCNECGTEMF